MLTFAGTAGQQVSVAFSNGNFQPSTSCLAVKLSLLKPDGSSLTSSGACSGGNVNVTLATQTLPTTGVYTVKLDPGDVVTGSATVSVTGL